MTKNAIDIAMKEVSLMGGTPRTGRGRAPRTRAEGVHSGSCPHPSIRTARTLVNYRIQTAKIVLRARVSPGSPASLGISGSPIGPCARARQARRRDAEHPRRAVRGLNLGIGQVVHAQEDLSVARENEAQRRVHDGGRGERKLVQVVIELGACVADAGREERPLDRVPRQPQRRVPAGHLRKRAPDQAGRHRRRGDGGLLVEDG